jgi:hypothetical protein
LRMKIEIIHFTGRHVCSQFPPAGTSVKSCTILLWRFVKVGTKILGHKDEPEGVLYWL